MSAKTDIVSTAKKELARLDALLQEASNLREHIDQAAENFAAGKIGIGEAAGLLAAANSADRAVLVGNLRAPVKRAMKDVLASLQDHVLAKRQAELDALKKQLADADAAERKIAESAAVPYTAGPAVSALTDRVQRAEAALHSPATRAEVDAL